MLDRESISPLSSRPRKALQIKSFFGPKALHISPMAAYPVTGLSPPLLLGTLRAVFRPVGIGEKVSATDGTGLHAVTVQQGSAQASIQGKDGGVEPLTDQRVGDALRADTFLAIVQEQTVPAVIITAAMYQPPGGAVLLVVHVDNHGSFSPAGNLM